MINSILQTQNYSFLEYILIFFFYSVVGWIVECLYCLYMDKKWTNRGFLFGPICPIYGCGALAMLLSLSWCKQSPWIMIPLGMVVCDAVEYLTSFLMEKIFHARWWDYSGHRFNLNGRICLRHTIFWGIAATIFMYVVDPFIGQKLFLWLRSLENGVKIEKYILIGILVLFTVDFAVAVKNALDIRKINSKMKQFSETLKKFTTVLSKGSAHDFVSLFKKESSQAVDEFNSEIESQRIKNNKGKPHLNRILSNYKDLSEQSKKTLNEIEDMLSETENIDSSESDKNN